MEKCILTLSPDELTLEALLSVLHVDKEDDQYEDILALHSSASKIARPVALFTSIAPVVTENAIELNAVRLDEPFVHKMLSSSATVVPYIATCGVELETWSSALTDIYQQYIADVIKNEYLRLIRERLFEEVKAQCFDSEKNISTLNPGSLEVWPLSGQTALFQVLENVSDEIGVVLTDSLLMLPTKSISGIIFQSEEAYQNCQLCPRAHCPNRSVPYIG